jgi:hypothetical protein
MRTRRNGGRSFLRFRLSIAEAILSEHPVKDDDYQWAARIAGRAIGEWVPTSIPTRHGLMVAKTCVRAFLVVSTLASLNTSPFSSNMQYRLVLSPKSIPTVTFIILVAFLLAFGLLQPLLFFFMAGLLLHFECVLGA